MLQLSSVGEGSSCDRALSTNHKPVQARLQRPQQIKNNLKDSNFSCKRQRNNNNLAYVREARRWMTVTTKKCDLLLLLLLLLDDEDDLNEFGNKNMYIQGL